jgi:hypothetical protein
MTATEREAMADGHRIDPHVSAAMRSAGFVLKHLGGNVYNYARPWGEEYLVGFDGNPPSMMPEAVIHVQDDREREYPSVTAAIKALGGKVARKATKARKSPSRAKSPTRKSTTRRR